MRRVLGCVVVALVALVLIGLTRSAHEPRGGTGYVAGSGYAPSPPPVPVR